MNIPRPWDTIEKAERAFNEFNRDQNARPGGVRLPARVFFDKCMAQLTGIAPVEKAALTRWVSSKMRG